MKEIDSNKCKDCKWLNYRIKTSVGYPCEHPERPFRFSDSGVAHLKAPSTKACKRFESGEYDDMTINSKQKGKRGELEIAHILQEHGYDARRSAQYCGNTGEAADVVGLYGFHVEVKFQETTKIWDWIEQAERDHKADTIPIVVFRKSRKKWQVCMDFETFLEIMGEYIAYSMDYVDTTEEALKRLNRNLTKAEE